MEHDADAVWWRDVASTRPASHGVRSGGYPHRSGRHQRDRSMPPPGRPAGQPAATRHPVRGGRSGGRADRAAGTRARCRHSAAERRAAHEPGGRPKDHVAARARARCRRADRPVHDGDRYVVFRLTGAYTTDHHNASYFAPFYDIRRSALGPPFRRRRDRSETLPTVLDQRVVGRVSRRPPPHHGDPCGHSRDRRDDRWCGRGRWRRCHPARRPDALLRQHVCARVRRRSVPPARPCGSLVVRRPGRVRADTAALSTSGSITTGIATSSQASCRSTGPRRARARHTSSCRGRPEAPTVGAQGCCCCPTSAASAAPSTIRIARGVIAG